MAFPDALLALRQENAFNHGAERWGINQLDGRQVRDVPVGTMVTNPLRANLERLLQDKREREKRRRLQAQQLLPGHPGWLEVMRALDENLADQQNLANARSRTPKKVTIEQTDLHGELKQHTRDYKLLIDTFRCVPRMARLSLPPHSRLTWQLRANQSGCSRTSSAQLEISAFPPMQSWSR
jgi:hypothetical protein